VITNDYNQAYKFVLEKGKQLGLHIQ
jgi:hypothetical protein